MAFKQFYYLSLLAIFLFSAKVIAQPVSIQQRIAQICQSKQATVGISALEIESGDAVEFHGTKHLPMQSVYKFPLALYILSQVDQGKFSLNEQIFIPKKELLPDTWSPLRDAHPDGDFYLPLSELIRYTVAQSDNNGCDILFRLAGGTHVVNDYIHQLGMKNISIKATEAEMHAEWNVQFSNWATSKAMTRLLALFYQEKILSKPTHNFLLKTMEATSTGTNKIKGFLPEGTIVAHKTGISGRNKQGVRGADNDAGIVTLPNGNHFAITVFVANSSENDETNARIIAEISKAVWDHFTAKQ